MKKGRRLQLTSQIGEYLAAVELGRRGYISTTFTQNVPDFDILAIDDSLKRTIPIQVKTKKKGGAWQSSTTEWMDIEMEGKAQKIKKKKEISNPNLIYVFVELGDEYGQDRFFILIKKEVQKVYYNSYFKWLEKHGGIRPKKPESKHCSFLTKEIEEYENNWGIIDKSI